MTTEALAALLPQFNASCNAASLTCLMAGTLAVKRRRLILHRNLMLAAFGFSMLFLVGYLTRHALSGTTYYQGPDSWRSLYRLILGTHTVLAVINLPLVCTTIILAFRQRLEAHKRIVRFTLPIWAYVSSTGILIYFILYVWFR